MEDVTCYYSTLVYGVQYIYFFLNMCIVLFLWYKVQCPIYIVTWHDCTDHT